VWSKGKAGDYIKGLPIAMCDLLLNEKFSLTMKLELKDLLVK